MSHKVEQYRNTNNQTQQTNKQIIKYITNIKNMSIQIENT